MKRSTSTLLFSIFSLSVSLASLAYAIQTYYKVQESVSRTKKMNEQTAMIIWQVQEVEAIDAKRIERAKLYDDAAVRECFLFGNELRDAKITDEQTWNVWKDRVTRFNQRMAVNR